MLRGSIIWLFAFFLSGAAMAAAGQTLNCTTPPTYDGRSESAAITFRGSGRERYTGRQ